MNAVAWILPTPIILVCVFLLGLVIRFFWNEGWDR